MPTNKGLEKIACTHVPYHEPEPCSLCAIRRSAIRQSLEYMAKKMCPFCAKNIPYRFGVHQSHIVNQGEIVGTDSNACRAEIIRQSLGEKG